MKTLYQQYLYQNLVDVTALMLTENEKRVLEALKQGGGKLSVEELEKATGLPKSTVMAIIELLKSRGAIREEATLRKRYALTKTGLDNLQNGFPEEVLIELLKRRGGSSPLKEVLEAMGQRGNIAVGELKKRGAVTIERGEVRLEKDISGELMREKAVLKEIAEKGYSEEEEVVRSLLRRGLLSEKIGREQRVAYVPQVADRLLAEARSYITKLTSDDILTGRWREAVFKEYNVEAYPLTLYPGLRHFFDIFLDKVRMILRDMGFTEFNYDFIVQEFWNFDVLFQAQDHPSREIHDTFWLDYSEEEIVGTSRELIEKIKRIHERGGANGIRGWGGEWREDVARRFILRTQMTSSTIRALSLRPPVPFRIYSIGKVYRPDQIDYKRLPEFTQLDGIISESGFTFRDLLSVLKDFFGRMGFERVKFKPAYFPFTEPSVEGYVYMEGRGWVEVFGAGLFRPEILEVFGYSENVGAWGMGLERLAMKLMGVDDIRTFYTKDVETLRRYYLRAIKSLGE